MFSLIERGLNIHFTLFQCIGNRPECKFADDTPEESKDDNGPKNESDIWFDRIKIHQVKHVALILVNTEQSEMI
jgi:hypothetical protein